MLTVIIPHSGNYVMLAQLLVSLQPQLHPEDDVYILDGSKDGSALKVSRLLATSRCFIFVEKVKSLNDMKEALATMRRNKQQGALIIQPNCVISTTFIANLKKAIKLGEEKVKVFIPTAITPPDGEMDPEFVWYQPQTTQIDEVAFTGDPAQLQCFYIKDSAFNENFDSSLVEDDIIGTFANETVVILPAIF